MRLRPNAPEIARSLRGLGYTTSTAIADLVDNSLSASATQIYVDFEWADGAPCVQVVDNGRGMSPEKLISAMRFGVDPRVVRPEGDLGRFGLGLKTASFSQATILTVVSKETDRDEAAARWDLDRIQATDDWELWVGRPSDINLAPCRLGDFPSGTAVRWDNLDRLLGVDRTIDAFLAVAEAVGKHLGETFHRLISAGSIDIRLNGLSVSPWNPVDDECSTLVEEIAVGPDGRTRCKSYVVQHPDLLSADVQKRAAGPRDWIQQQGFYIYRENRLVVSGGWFGLGPPDKPWRLDKRYNLARLTIDITNADDEAWSVDVRKSSAAIPDAIKATLYAFAKRVRRRAISRSKAVTRETLPGAGKSEHPPIWIARSAVVTSPYRVNRRHPLVAKVRKQLPDASQLRALLDHIEETAPLSPASSVANPSLVASAAQVLQEKNIRKLVLTLYTNYRRSLSLSKEEACARLLALDQFSDHQVFVLSVVETIERDMQSAT